MIINGLKYDEIVVNDKNGETVAIISDNEIINYEGYEVILADKDDQIINLKLNSKIGTFKIDKDFNVTKLDN